MLENNLKGNLNIMLWIKIHFVPGQTVGIPKCGGGGGGYSPFSTIVFLEVRTTILENLSDGKVLYVIKGCPKNLVRAKSALRAQNLRKTIFGATDLYPPMLVFHIVIKKNQHCKCLLDSLKILQNFFQALKHDL